MNRVNFLKHQPENESAAIAASRTTFYSPIDFVGEVRVTRFRLSRETLPILLLKPSSKPFTRRQKDNIRSGRTPTDIAFLVFSCVDLRDTQTVINNGCTYEVTNGSITGIRSPFSEYVRYWELPLTRSQVLWATIVRIFIPEAPRWEQKGDDEFVLANQPLPIYSWNDLHNKTIFSTTSYVDRNLQVPTFYLHLIDKDDGKPAFFVKMFSQESSDLSDHGYTSPTIGFTVEAMNIFGLNSGQNPVCRVTTLREFCPEGYDVNEVIHFYVPQMRYEWNPKFQLCISNLGSAPLSQNIDFTCTFDPILQIIPKSFFPVSHILITANELSFEGEKINVNTKAQQGVVSPSNLQVLKSFFVGLSSSNFVSSSDFIYVDDSLNTAPKIVNSPRLCSLTIQLFYLTTDGYLYPLVLSPGTSFAIQLSIA